MDNINWNDIEEAYLLKSPPKEELIGEIINIKKQRNEFVNFVGWIMDNTQYCTFNSQLKETFLKELDLKIDEVFNIITKDK